MAAIDNGPIAIAPRYAAVAPMSRTPTPTTAGQSPRGTCHSCGRTTSHAVMTTIDVARMTRSGERISSSGRNDAEIVKRPKSVPAPIAYWSPFGRPSPAFGARMIRITFTTANPITMTATCEGRPSVRKPNATGSPAVRTAAIGATTPIRPAARPRYRSASPVEPKTPPAIDTAMSSGRIAGSLTNARRTRPTSRLATWLPPRTPSAGARRLVRPPPKSPKPQPIDASRPRRTTTSVGGKRESGTRISSRLPMHGVARTLPPLLALAISVLGAGVALGQMTLPPSEEGRYVYDLAEIWTPDTEARAQSIADAIRTRTEGQLAVVSWPSEDFDVATDTAREDAITIMNTWGVGRAGVNDGLVVLFDMDNGSASHGQIYLYAGRGFEDSYLNRDEISVVVNEAMLPRARDGDIDGALLAGLERVDRAAQVRGNPDRAGQTLLILVLAAFVLGVGLLAFAAFLRTWWQQGRDAAVPLIDDSVLMPVPPPGLTPALATVLRNDGIDKESFTSALVDLGHRGLVTFEQAEDDAKKVDLVVPRKPLVDPSSLEARRRPLGQAEKDLARSIAAKSSGGVLSWTSLKAGEGAKLWESFKQDIGSAAKRSGYFREDPNRLPGRWTGIGVIVIVAVVLFGFVFVFDLSEDSELLRPARGVLWVPMLASVILGILVIVLS